MKDLDQGLEGRDLLVVEDIVDTGLTLNYLLNVLRARGPRTLKVAALLSKPSRRLVRGAGRLRRLHDRRPVRRRLRPRLQREVPQPARHRRLRRLTVPERVRYVLGIDAGGTKTVGLLADETGRVVGEARGDGANLYTHGELAGREGLRRHHRDVRGRTRSHRPRSAWASRASTGRTTRRSSAASCAGSATARRARVVNDAVIALVAGAPERFGIVRAGGHRLDRLRRRPRRGARRARAATGRCSRTRARATGSATRRCARAVRASDGRGPADAPAGSRVRARWRRTSMAEVVPRVYEQALPKHRHRRAGAARRAGARRGRRRGRPTLIRQRRRRAGARGRGVGRARSWRSGGEPYPGRAGGRRLQGVPVAGRDASSAAWSLPRRVPRR